VTARAQAGIRLWAVCALAFGLLTLVWLVEFNLLPRVHVAYPHGEFAAAENAFQQAATMADLNAVFGVPPGQAQIAAMTQANRADLYGFVPSYALFLLCGAAMLAGGIRKPLAWLAVAPLLVGLIGDVLETQTQLRITADYAHAASFLPVKPFAWMKWFGLALSALGASGICFLGAPRRPILGVLGIAPILATAATYFGLLHIQSLLTLGFALFWLPLLVLAVPACLSRASPAPSASR
jgi:hypothetical protein